MGKTAGPAGKDRREPREFRIGWEVCHQTVSTLTIAISVGWGSEGGNEGGSCGGEREAFHEPPFNGKLSSKIYPRELGQDNLRRD